MDDRPLRREKYEKKGHALIDSGTKLRKTLKTSLSDHNHKNRCIDLIIKYFITFPFQDNEKSLLKAVAATTTKC